MNFEKNKKGFRLFGLDKQDIIKYFFGGNASLAVCILFLIIFFLLKEGWNFLPNHHQQMQNYRRSGLEYFTAIEKVWQQYKVDVNTLNKAYAAELALPNKDNQRLISAYSATRLEAEKILGRELLLLKDATKQLKNVYPKDGPKADKLKKVIAESTAEIDAQRDQLKKLLPKRVKELKKKSLFSDGISATERDKIVDGIVALQFEKRDESEYYDQLEADFDKVQEGVFEHASQLSKPYSAIRFSIPKPLNELWKEASKHAVTTRDRIESNASVEKRVKGQVGIALHKNNIGNLPIRQQKFGEAMGVIANAEFFNEYARLFYLQRFTQAIRNLNESGSYYQSVPRSIRQKTEGILNGVTGDKAEFLEAVRSNDLVELKKRIEAIPTDPGSEEIQPKGVISEAQRELLLQLADLQPGTDDTIDSLSRESGVFVNPFPFATEAAVLYSITDRYHAAVEKIKTEGGEAIASLPEVSSLKSADAQKSVRKFKKDFESNIKKLEKTGQKLDNWKHDRTWTIFQTASAFFLGKVWTNNSEIQDRYGVLPLFTGSLIIAIIALSIAVPLSVAGAIYVNQIAGFKEQSFIKPAIEFIEAIPSVVLGFLGIAVVSNLLKDLSLVPWLEWVPGFPIEGRLNMLVAGVLLAFMACPIIFTLAEDALNNVPSAYRDGALSMGASRLQTAFRVVLPAASSGVFAAILLGFGRVIGETMVVLLVAGNRVSIPDFTAGAGVFTQPAHTMTGMVAQGLGEAAHNSIDWWALFMVGVVLFVITLTINFIGQKILKRFEIK